MAPRLFSPGFLMFLTWSSGDSNGLLGMQFSWKNMPALRLLLPWMAGILTQHYMPWGSSFLWTGLGVFFLIWTGRWYWADKQKLRWSLVPGVLLSAVFFFAGGLRVAQQDIRNDPFWLGHQEPPLQQVLMLDESFQRREKSWKATASLLFFDNNRFRASSGQRSRATLPPTGGYRQRHRGGTRTGSTAGAANDCSAHSRPR